MEKKSDSKRFEELENQIYGIRSALRIFAVILLICSLAMFFNYRLAALFLVFASMLLFFVTPSVPLGHKKPGKSWLDTLSEEQEEEEEEQKEEMPKPKITVAPRAAPAKVTPLVKEAEEITKKKIPTKPLPKPRKITPKEKVSLELDIGKRWFPIIGAISLVLGMAFLTKYAFDHNWISPIARLFLGVGVSIVLIAASEFVKEKKLRFWANTLSGAGISIAYFTFWAGYYIYDGLIPFPIMTIGLSAVILVGIGLSLNHDSQIIAGLAFLLGYLTAYLTRTVYESTALIYALLLTLAIVYLANQKGWRFISMGSIFFTYLIHFTWYARHPTETLIHLVFITLYLFIFSFMSISLSKFVEIPKEYKAELVGKYFFAIILSGSFFITILSGNLGVTSLFFIPLFGALAIGMAFKNSWLELPTISGAWAYIGLFMWYSKNVETQQQAWLFFGMTALFFVVNTFVTYLIASKSEKSNYLGPLSALANSLIAYVFVITALRQHFNGEYLSLATVIFGIESIVLFFLIKKPQSLRNAYLTIGLGYLTLAIPLEYTGRILILGWLIETALLLVIGLNTRSIITRIFGYIAGFLAFLYLLVKIGELEKFSWPNVLASERILLFVFAAAVYYFCGFIVKDNADEIKGEEHFLYVFFYIIGSFLVWLLIVVETARWASALWAIYAIILLVVAIVRKDIVLRWCSYIVYGTMFFKLFFIDRSAEDFIISSPFSHSRLLLFIIGAASLIIACFMIKRIKDVMKKDERYIVYVLGTAGVYLLWDASLMEYTKWVSLIWGILGLVVLTYGFIKKSGYSRCIAYIIFATMLLKTVFLDNSAKKFIFLDLLGSTRFLIYASVSIILFVAGYLARMAISAEKKEEEKYAYLALVSSGIFVLWLLAFLEAIKWAALYWSIIALGTLIYGYWRDAKYFRLFAYIIFSTMMLKLIAFDIEAQGFTSSDFWQSTRVILYVGCSVILLAAAYLSRRASIEFKSKDDKQMADIADIGFAIIIFILLFKEFSEKTISVAWGIEGIVLLLLGFILKNRVFRLSGIVVLAVVILKVFLYDLRGLEPLWRIISFIVLGVILLGAGFIYSKYSEEIKKLI